MNGIAVAVYVLTFQCFGPSCRPNMMFNHQLETKSQEACLFMRDAAMSRSTADAVVVADCVGQMREARMNFGRLD